MTNGATEDQTPAVPPVPPAEGPVPRVAVGVIAVLIASAIVFVAVWDGLSSDFDGSKPLFILSMLELGTLGVDASKWLRR